MNNMSIYENSLANYYLPYIKLHKDLTFFLQIKIK